MQITKKFELLLTVPWGKSSMNLTPQYKRAYAYSEISLGEDWKIYSPILFRIDSKNGLHLLDVDMETGAKSILYFDQDQTFQYRLEIPPSLLPLSSEVLDFIVDDENNYFLLEQVDSQLRVFKVDTKGKLLWEHFGSLSKPCSFETYHGRFNRIFLGTSSTIYITCEDNFHSIGVFDRSGGDFVKEIHFDEGSNQIYTSITGALVRVAYLKEQNQRTISYYDPQTEEQHFLAIDKDLFGSLLFSFGIDEYSNCYLYQEPHLIKVGTDSSKHIENIHNLFLVLEPDVIVFETSISKNSKIFIKEYPKSGKNRSWELNPPKNISLEDSQNLRLIKIDKNHNFYLAKGDPEQEKILVFSRDGVFKEELGSGDEDWITIGTTVQNYQTWQINNEGQIYIPITGPVGFSILRFQFHK